MGMFEYTPQKTQPQVSDIPQVKTESRIGAAFDSLSKAVSSVGTAVKEVNQIDYYFDNQF